MGPSGSFAAPAPPPQKRTGVSGIKRLLLALALGLAAFVALFAWCAVRASAYPVAALASRVPEQTELMRQRDDEARREGRKPREVRHWVPYSQVSPLLRRAVLIAEDAAFYQHGGLDWNEIKASARKNWEKRRIVRGGSTITQQLAKNLFLGDHRTPTRKLTEIALAWRLERALTKQRIFELYLNLIEWGDGVYGADAAARHYFGTSAAGLDERQSMLLAAIIINPRRYSPLAPAKRILGRVRMIAGRMRRLGHLSEDQYRQALGLPRVEAPIETITEAPMDSAGTEAAPPPEEQPQEPPADTSATPA